MTEPAILGSLARAVRAVQPHCAFALVGGLAVSVRAEPRMTRDCDFAVAVNDDDEAEQLIRLLGVDGYSPVAITEQSAAGRLSTVRLQHPDDAGRLLDLLFASSGIEPEITVAATLEPVSRSMTVPVAVVGHLIALKLLARDDRARPNDADDLRALRDVATHSDWVIARNAVDLIQIRGYDRGRNLSASLADLQARGPH